MPLNYLLSFFVPAHRSFTSLLLLQTTSLLPSSPTSHVLTFSNQSNLFLPPSASQERKEKNQRLMAYESSDGMNGTTTRSGKKRISCR
ncbi:unnamed protein product [Linum trigynum]|uniref:Secreted protein n=1 Tax=Linum trigynum TaxID=586398 RepID=A0AAV2GY45_9ROSI